MSRKIIIPKGLVNPNETTVIEIPEELSEERELIASPALCPQDCNRHTQSGTNYGDSDRTSRSPSFRQPQASFDSHDFGRTYSGSRPSTETIEEYEETTHSAPCGTSKVVKKTSKTFMKQPMPKAPCGNTFTKTPELNKSRPVCPALQPISPSVPPPQAMYNSRGCGVGGRTVNLGRAKPQSPRSGPQATSREPGFIETTESYMETNDGTSRVVQKNSKIIKRGMDYPGGSGGQAANRTYARSPDQNRTRDMTVFHPTITSTPFDIEYSSIYDSSLVELSTETSGSSSGYYEPGKTYNFPYANTGRSASPNSAAGRTYNMRSQNTCPGMSSRMFSASRGRPESLSIGAPQATSTPQPNLTYSDCVDSSLFRSNSFDPNTFGMTNSNSAAGATFNYGRTHIIPPGSAPPGRTYNMGQTHNVCPGIAARGTNVGKTRSSNPIHSIGAPQATSTPQGNFTYTQLVDSSLFRSHSFEPSSFGTISSSYPDSGAMLGRTYNAGKTQNICPGAKQGSQSYTKITKRSSKTFDRPPIRSNDIGTLGTAYMNSTRPSCVNGCPNSQRTYSKPQSSAANQTRVITKKTSKTTMKSSVNDGARTRTIHEVTSVESTTEGANASATSDIEQRLAEMENIERSQLAAELRNYQDARRNLMTNTTYNLGDTGSRCDSKCPSKNK